MPKGIPNQSKKVVKSKKRPMSQETKDKIGRAHRALAAAKKAVVIHGPVESAASQLRKRFDVMISESMKLAMKDELRKVAMVIGVARIHLLHDIECPTSKAALDAGEAAATALLKEAERIGFDPATL